jgi:putative ABC transport system substrate-binding protein
MVAVLGLLVWILATSSPAEAQAPGDIRRIGYLSAASPDAVTRFVEAFRQGLRELGWVEGQNIVIEYRWAHGHTDRLAGLAAELVALKPDVIVAGPVPPAIAAKNATRTIPIVMTAVGDPVRLELVSSLARPGGNVTGTSFDVALEVFAKQLELLTETVPKLRRVAVLSNSANPAQGIALKDVTAAAKPLRVQVQHVAVRGPADFDRAFAAMRKERAEALLVLADSMFAVHRVRLAELSTTNRLPSMFGFREYVQDGGLLSSGPSLPDVFRRAARFVDKILKGARPADLPVEQPTTFELVVNRRTAKGLGVAIPQSVLLRADHVIE